MTRWLAFHRLMLVALAFLVAGFVCLQSVTPLAGDQHAYLYSLQFHASGQSLYGSGRAVRAQANIALLPTITWNRQGSEANAISERVCDPTGITRTCASVPATGRLSGSTSGLIALTLQVQNLTAGSVGTDYKARASITATRKDTRTVRIRTAWVPLSGNLAVQPPGGVVRLLGTLAFTAAGQASVCAAGECHSFSILHVAIPRKEVDLAAAIPSAKRLHAAIMAGRCSARRFGVRAGRGFAPSCIRTLAGGSVGQTGLRVGLPILHTQPAMANGTLRAQEAEELIDLSWDPLRTLSRLVVGGPFLSSFAVSVPGTGLQAGYTALALQMQRTVNLNQRIVFTPELTVELQLSHATGYLLLDQSGKLIRHGSGSSLHFPAGSSVDLMLPRGTAPVQVAPRFSLGGQFTDTSVLQVAGSVSVQALSAKMGNGTQSSSIGPLFTVHLPRRSCSATPLFALFEGAALPVDGCTTPALSRRWNAVGFSTMSQPSFTLR